MNARGLTLGIWIAGALAFHCVSALAQVTSDVPAKRADSIVDLRTAEGAQLVHGEWRYSDAQIVDAAHNYAGSDLKPSGPSSKTHDITPKAGASNFDDSAWAVVDPASLSDRRGPGKLSYSWYRVRFTVPEKLGTFETKGSTAVFEIVVDDYAEIWVDGKLPAVLGSAGGQFPKGFNSPNRVIVGKNVQPGQQFTLAVFAANGPLSNPPSNYIWVRSATLDFYKPDHIGNVREVATEIERDDPALDSIIAPGRKIEKLADGFTFTEGPVWVKDENGGYLLFSDPNENTIYRWVPDGQVSVYRTKSGYTGVDIGEYFQPGSNGLALDGEGRLTIDEHGNRRITRLEKNGVITVLADQYQGKRLNSPNDLVYKSDGALYFTDPPFGLPKAYYDKRKELPFSGVFRLKDGKLQLLTTELKGPNGLAFSPDEKYFYVDNWDVEKKVVMRYQVQPDGSLVHGKIFYDMTSVPGEIALDGLKVDRAGNVFVSGPGGVWIISPEGKHLGTIQGPELPANFAWGDPDGRTLYMTARTGLYRIRLNNAGAGPFVDSAN
jgi:gluconolactonase